MRLSKPCVAFVLPLTLVALLSCGSDDDDDSAEVSTPVTEASSTETPSTEASSTETPSTEASSTETPSTEASSTEAPSTEVPEDITPGGSLNFVSYGQFPSWDPATLSFIGPQGLEGPLVYDTLVRVDIETEEVIPRLAESLESDDTLSTWTITLRDGVTFTDGTPFDAEAVMFNWDRLKDPALASQCKSRVDPLTYSASDERTITIELPAPQVAFPYTVWECLSRIASKAAIEEFGAEYGSSADKVVGAGAFTVSEWVPGTSYSLQKNPDFWDAPRPYLDELTILASPDNNATMDAILSGTSGGGQFSTFDANYARGQEAELLEVTNLSAGGVGQFFNFSKPPFDDVRVRKALQLATDLDDFNEKAADGQLPLLDAYFTEDSPYYDPEIVQPTNDLEAAQALIDEYVAETGGPVSFEFLGAETFNLINTTLQQQWSRLDNVDISYTQIGNTDWRTRQSSGDFQITAGISNCNDPECFYTRYHTGSVANITASGSPELDALIDAARQEPDVEARKELFSQITQLTVIDDPQGVLLYRLGNPWFFDPDVVGGIEVYDRSNADLTTAWLNQ